MQESSTRTRITEGINNTGVVEINVIQEQSKRGQESHDNIIAQLEQAKERENANNDVITRTKCELNHQIETSTLLQQENAQLKITIAALREDSTRSNEQLWRLNDEAKRLAEEVDRVQQDNARLRTDAAAVLQVLGKQKGLFAWNVISLLSASSSMVISTAVEPQSQVVSYIPPPVDASSALGMLTQICSSVTFFYPAQVHKKPMDGSVRASQPAPTTSNGWFSSAPTARTVEIPVICAKNHADLPGIKLTIVSSLLSYCRHHRSAEHGGENDQSTSPFCS